MLTKRNVVLGGLLSIISGPICARCYASSEIRGCIISGEAATSYLGGATFSPGDSIISRSGNNDFDYAVAQTLSRLTDIFDVLPGFAYYKVGDERNARATPQRLMSNPDGTVLFGRALMFEMLNGPDAPDAAFSAVCAHEFGHIVQFKNGIVLDSGQPTVKHSELHADFLSGYYAGRRKLQKLDFPAAVFATTYEKFGDFNLNNPQHHGTPSERAAAIVRGFEVAYQERRGTSDAIQAGINYVSQL
jgi:hypothetical protein